MKTTAIKCRPSDTGTQKRFIRRDENEQFDVDDEVSQSLSQDVRRAAKTTVAVEQGGRGEPQRRN